MQQFARDNSMLDDVSEVDNDMDSEMKEKELLYLELSWNLH